MLIATARAYEPRFLGVGTEEFRRVAVAAAMLIAAIGTVSWALKAEFARGYVVLTLPLALVLTLLLRCVVRKQVYRLHTSGVWMQRVLAVGHAASVADLVDMFRRDANHGLRVVGACLPTLRGAPGEIAEDVPVLGAFDDVAEAVRRSAADVVAVLAHPDLDGMRLRRLAWWLEQRGVDLIVAPALLDIAGPRTTIRPVCGLPLLHVDPPELSGGRRIAKGVFDRFGALIGLLVLLPVLLAIAVVVATTSPGPVLFRQTRVGKGGREFTIYKFRTMLADAEQRLDGLRHLNEQAGGVLFKVRADPRVTPVGAWLRRYSLDELPQLLNVLTGSMSLVGPRPPLPMEVARYGDDVHRRLLVKPGLTGLWQISGRSDLCWEDTVRLDLRYVENWSLGLDLAILWRNRVGRARRPRCLLSGGGSSSSCRT